MLVILHIGGLSRLLMAVVRKRSGHFNTSRLLGTVM